MSGKAFALELSGAKDRDEAVNDRPESEFIPFRFNICRCANQKKTDRETATKIVQTQPRTLTVPFAILCTFVEPSEIISPGSLGARILDKVEIVSTNCQLLRLDNWKMH